MLPATAVTFVYFIGCVLCAPTTTHHSNLIKWVNVTQVSILDLEPAGAEILDPLGTNLTIYLARTVYHDLFHTNIQTGIIPGKIISQNNQLDKLMHYSVNGREFLSNEFEVLTYPRGSVSWISDEMVTPLDEKVIGGIDPFTSELLYLCRIAHVNELLPRLTRGKLTSSGECLVPFFGEISTKVNYEVLVVNAYGKFLGA